MTENDIQQLFEGKQLKDISLYGINGNYIELSSNRSWIVHAGIQLRTEEGVVSFGIKPGEDISTLYRETVETMCSDYPISELGAMEIEGFKELNDQTVSSAKILGFEAEFDDGSSDYLVESVELNFSSGQLLQIAAVDIQMEGEEIQQLLYSIYGATLVTLDRIEVQYAEGVL